MRVFLTSIIIAAVLLMTVTLPASSTVISPDIDKDQSLSSIVSSQTLSTEDPYFEQQWALNYINLPQSTAIDIGRPVKVAILDTGIDNNHEDLTGKVNVCVNFTDSPTTEDRNGHGTHVAGIIAARANNNIGIAGISPQAILINVKVANDNGYCRAEDVAKGIRWAVDNGVDVINISLELRDFSAELEKTVDYAWNQGVIVVAAAGNDASDTPKYPAYMKNCIAVSAIGQHNELAPLANYGDWVDVVAPGVNIYSTTPGNLYEYKTGTSFAAAYVSGLAAILCCFLVDSNSDGRTNDEVRYAIENGCKLIDTEGTGYGLIDVSRSLNISG